MGKMGQAKMGNLSQIVSFFSDFPPISYEFHTFSLHFPLGIFGTFSYFPIPPHFPPFPSIFLHSPPFPPISPHFTPFFSIFPCSPFFFTSVASWLIRLRLTPTPTYGAEHLTTSGVLLLDKKIVENVFESPARAVPRSYPGRDQVVPEHAIFASEISS